MENDTKALLEIAAWIAVSMTYARFVSSSTRPGMLRLLSLLPVVALLPFLPWRLNSIHLRGVSAFFLVWLGIFKLLLLSFGLGPLSPSLPLPTFLVVSSFPVMLLHSKPPPHHIRRLLLSSLVRFILLFTIISTYRYKEMFHPYLLVLAYSLHMYLTLELVLACTALLVRVVLGFDLEPHFNAPYRSTSLGDFWGRRWNLTVTGILRPSVYIPVSARWGPAAGVMATFLVSGLMHEVMFWYITAVPPTGEVSCFFLLHGACVVAELGWRRKGLRWPGPAVAGTLTVGFVAVTAYWLFVLPLLRNISDRIVLEESAAAVRVLEDLALAVLSRVAA